MKAKDMDRRSFIKTSLAGAAALGIAREISPSGKSIFNQANALPKWRGFNLLDYFNPVAYHGDNGAMTTEEDMKWMSGWGFDFVRIPMAYPRYLNIDPKVDIKPEDVYKINEQALEPIDRLVHLANRYGMHVSLNLHRAPGYCVNSGFHEPFNLWKDQAALNAFCYHWEMWAKRYKDIPNDKISFDLVNEPGMREDMNDQHSRRSTLPGDVYHKVAAAATQAIRKVKPGAIVIADGNNTGSSVTPELADLNIAQSCRGYFPGEVSHYKAPWAFKDPDQCPVPVWPGKIGNKEWSRKDLEAFYKPWIDIKNKGVGVHCGEAGCWIKTPHDVFLSWFGDVLGILSENGIGYALWNFRGDFGILDSNREDVAYEDWHGHKLDRKLLNLLQKNS